MGLEGELYTYEHDEEAEILEDTEILLSIICNDAMETATVTIDAQNDQKWTFSLPVHRWLGKGEIGTGEDDDILNGFLRRFPEAEGTEIHKGYFTEHDSGKPYKYTDFTLDHFAHFRLGFVDLREAPVTMQLRKNPDGTLALPTTFTTNVVDAGKKFLEQKNGGAA